MCALLINSNNEFFISFSPMLSFFGQELIPYRYSSSCSHSCWGDAFFKKPKSPTFQIGSG